jgi:hypothetical protein
LLVKLKQEWESCWSGVSLLATLIAVYVPGLNAMHDLVLGAAWCATLCGLFVGMLYLCCLDTGRHWLGSFLPFALAGWGIWLLLHVPLA